MKDLYYILGIDRDCTPGELQSAYQKLVRKLQPDGQEHDHFLEHHLREISEAYHILSDPGRRHKYDAAYNKNYQRRLYYFKIKYLDIAVTLALLLFTGLFGWYVFKAMRGDKTKQLTKAESEVKSVPAVLSKPVHHKRKHNAVASTINKPVTIKIDSTAGVIIKPAATTKPDNAPTSGQNDRNPAPASTVYTTYLQSNITGIIYLHQSVSYSSAVLARIPNHSKVTVLEKGAEFYKVTFNDQSGYVPKWSVGNP